MVLPIRFEGPMFLLDAVELVRWMNSLSINMMMDTTEIIVV